MVLMAGMTLGGLGLVFLGAHAAQANHASQQQFDTAARCRAGISASAVRRTDCVGQAARRVTYVSTMKDSTTVGLDDAQELSFDRAPGWILRLRTGESVSVLSWRGEDEALRSPGLSTVYSQDSPMLAEDNHLAAALLGAAFACCGAAMALGCAKAGFDRCARAYYEHKRVYDLLVFELSLFAVASVLSAVLVGRGDLRSGILAPLITIPLATAVAAVVYRARLRRDLLASQLLANQFSSSGGA